MIYVPRFLSKLRDAVITSPANGEVLAYDTALAKWKNAAAAGGSSAQYMIVVDEKAQGTPGGTPVGSGYQIRTLNTVKANTITGASLASNQITLPAGTYYVEIISTVSITGASRVKLYNVTDAANTIIGFTGYEGIAINTNLDANGVFTIATQKAFEVRQYFQPGFGSNAFGQAHNLTGETELYCLAYIEKVG